MADIADDKRDTQDPQQLLSEITTPIDATMSPNSSFVDHQTELKGPRTMRLAIELAEGERWDPEERRVISNEIERATPSEEIDIGDDDFPGVHDRASDAIRDRRSRVESLLRFKAELDAKREQRIQDTINPPSGEEALRRRAENEAFLKESKADLDQRWAKFMQEIEDASQAEITPRAQPETSDGRPLTREDLA